MEYETDESEDVIKETFLKSLAARLNNWIFEEKLKLFIYKIGKNTARNVKKLNTFFVKQQQQQLLLLQKPDSQEEKNLLSNGFHCANRL